MIFWKPVLIISLVCLTKMADGQILQPNHNIKVADSFVNNLKKYFCQNKNLVYYSNYKKSKINEDKKLIELINKLSSNKTPETFILAQLNEKKKSRRFSDEIAINGLIKTHQIFAAGNYLRIKAILEFIGDTLIRSRIELYTEFRAECESYGKIVTDYNFLINNVLGYLNEEFKPDFDYLYYDTVFIDNLKNLSLNRTDYTFNIPALDNETWINEIYLKQYRSEYSCCYKRNSADPEFAQLIKEKKFHIIESLLFSPNYYTSIHAMEALAYLSYKKLIQLSPESLQRMDYIKNASFHVMMQGAPDVTYRKEGYKSLHSLIEHVIKKYRIELSN